MRLTSLIAAGLACTVLAACGNDDQGGSFEEPQNAASGASEGLLAAADVANVQSAMESITADCEGASQEDVDALVDAYSANGPEAIYEPGNSNVGKSIRQVLEIKRDELADCGQEDLADELDQALATS